MADNSGLVKLALIGGGAYVAWKMGWLASFGVPAPATAPATGTGTGTSPTTTGTPATPVVSNSLDAIWTRVQAAAQPPSTGYNVDQWNYFLNQELAKIGKVAPDPMDRFPNAISGFQRRDTLTASQYWAIQAPVLRSQLGLSGLGMYGTMAQMGMGYY